MNKRLISSALALSAVVGSVNAAPLVSIGNFADLYFNGSAGFRYQSNVYYTDTNERGDTAFIFSPGLELSLGRKGAEFTGTFGFREDIKVYFDENGLDNETANVFFNGRYDTGVFKLDAYANFAEVDQNTQDIRAIIAGGPVTGDLVEREITTAGFYGEYTFSNKFGFGAGANLAHTYFQTYQPFFADSTVFTIPADLYYKFSQKLDFSVGYQYRDTDVEGPSDSTDHFFNVGARGELAPKVSGRVRVGWTTRDYDLAANSNEDSFTVITGLTYTPTQKIGLNLDIVRDLGTSGQGAGVENTNIRLGGTYKFSPFISGDAGVSYEKSDYNSGVRDDETLSFTVGASYTPNDYIKLSVGYVFQDNDSSLAGYDYTNNVINVTASLRY